MVIDTNIFIEHLRAKDKSTTTLYKIGSGDLYISVITLYELLMGATDASKFEDVKLVTSGVTILPLDENIIRLSAEIFHSLKKKNKLVGYRDIFIGATALYYNFYLVTSNKSDFKNIENLIII